MLGAVLSLALLSAPVPPPRPQCPVRAAELVGTWRVEWGLSLGTVAFNRDGTYRCLLGDTAWAGSWCVREGTLGCSEWQEDHPAGTRLVWAFPLVRTPSGWEGRNAAGHTIRILRR